MVSGQRESWFLCLREIWLFRMETRGWRSATVWAPKLCDVPIVALPLGFGLYRPGVATCADSWRSSLGLDRASVWRTIEMDRFRLGPCWSAFMTHFVCCFSGVVGPRAGLLNRVAGFLLVFDGMPSLELDAGNLPLARLNLRAVSISDVFICSSWGSCHPRLHRAGADLYRRRSGERWLTRGAKPGGLSFWSMRFSEPFSWRLVAGGWFRFLVFLRRAMVGWASGFKFLRRDWAHRCAVVLARFPVKMWGPGIARECRRRWQRVCCTELEADQPMCPDPGWEGRPYWHWAPILAARCVGARWGFACLMAAAVRSRCLCVRDRRVW